ncbi:MAG: ROK family protein [Bacilli bacterium]|nr:ROK family protein [Bacilli bacterium]
MKQLIFDIGGTYIKYAYFVNNEVKFDSFPVINQDGKEDVPYALKNFLKNYQVDEIGVSMPGPFDFKNGISLMDFKLKSLYQVNVMSIFKEACPQAKIVFIHDAVAFILGTLNEDPKLKTMRVAGVMLGTGTGFACMDNGRVMVSENEITIPHLGRQIYDNTNRKIDEFISATGLIRLANELGYHFKYVKEMAEAAKIDKRLQETFLEVGQILGKVMNQQQVNLHFTYLLIGGGVSNVWHLLKPAFERVCHIPYRVVNNLAMCPINGVRLALRLGKDNIYLKQ